MNLDIPRALLGGALIGLSAALLLLTHGRIAGISGILQGALTPAAAGRGNFRYAFLFGLLGGGALLGALWPQRFDMSGLPSWPLLVVAGVLVGVGTQVGGGCTSGHGVCGIGRGSPRSFFATLTFMLVAAATVFVVRHTS
jgi:uncharacterized membrane protein YedE/YeeE